MINQVEFNGSKFHYDACCQHTAPGVQPWERGPARSKEEIMNVYPHMRYIGASYTTYHDGVKNEWPEVHHFFVHDAEAKKAYEDKILAEHVTDNEEEPTGTDGIPVITLDIMFAFPIQQIEAFFGNGGDE